MNEMNQEERHVTDGTVTISIAEYRELIELNVKNEMSAEENRTRRWEAIQRAEAAESNAKVDREKLSSVMKLNERFAEFISTDVDVAAKYKEFLLNRKGE